MRVGLYSQRTGGNAQYEAIYRRPDLFENVACMCSPMVVSMAAIFSAFSELQGQLLRQAPREDHLLLQPAHGILIQRGNAQPG